MILEKDGDVFAVEWLDSVDSWSPGVPLAEGIYRWTVQSWSLAGFGALSNSVAFSYDDPATPGPASMMSGGSSGMMPVAGLMSSAMLTSSQFEGIAGSAEDTVENSPVPAGVHLAPTDGSPDFEPMAAISLAETDGAVTDAVTAGEDEPAGMSAAVEAFPDLSIQDAGLELAEPPMDGSERPASDETPAAAAVQGGDGSSSAAAQTGETGTDFMSPTMGYIAPIDIVVGPMSSSGIKQNPLTDKKLEEEPDGNGDGGRK